MNTCDIRYEFALFRLMKENLEYWADQPNFGGNSRQDMLDTLSSIMEKSDRLRSLSPGRLWEAVIRNNPHRPRPRPKE